MPTYPAINQIETLLLDMDGTLLDLRFDNFFWTSHLPERYAEIHDIHPIEADQHVENSLCAHEGTMQWYCIDHWSSHFEVDIMSLKQEIVHLVQFREGAKEFLEHLQAADHLKVYLVTDAHPSVLELKQETTQLQHHVHGTCCSHEFGVPKRHPEFWQKLAQVIDFDPKTTLMIDDSPHVLAQARRFGIRHQLCIKTPDSGREETHDHDFTLIDNLYDLVSIPASTGL